MFEMNREFFDSRDLIERLEELEELEGIINEGEASPEEIEEWNESEDEYRKLKEFADYAEANCEDWPYGETFIHADYFAQYSKELVSDVGYLPDNLPDFIEDNIDWEGVADDLKVDYTEFELDGNTYYAR